MSQETQSAQSPERLALRERYGVRVVTTKEEGANIRRLPEGVYGFTTAPASEEIPLFTQPMFRAFEVHKLSGGELQFVGYLSAKDHAAWERGLEATIDLFPEPHGEATRLVAIPQSRIDRRKLPSRDNGNWMALEIAPKAEFLGMASSVN